MNSSFLKTVRASWGGMRTLGRPCILVGVVLIWPRALLTQHTPVETPREQFGFNYEFEIDPIQRPVKPSAAALQTLSKDKLVASCLRIAGLRPEELPGNWFVASEIHLTHLDELDLIVLPGGRLPDTPAGEISRNACLVGANTGGFWVLRKTPIGFELVLSEMAHNLEILKTRSHGFRDIRLYTISLRSTTIQDFKFDGKQYRLSGTQSRPNS
jgi:hypothetical protein